MKRIKNNELAQLLSQLRFAPLKQRSRQLEASEKLFELIEKNREYPFDFVCFHITGFRPTGPEADKLIKGEELADDLRNFIAALSSQICPPASEQNQKVYTLEEFARTLEVSTKTINRWRTRGLITRKFLFPDGRKCLGFLQTSIDKFLQANPDLIANAKNFHRLTKAQKTQIAKQAKSLASKAGLSRHRIILKIASDTGLSHETIRYTLLNYEKANPEKAVFKKPSGVIDPAHASEMYRLFQQGTSVKELMQRFHRTKSSIYRIINERRARALMAKKIEFISSDEFLKPDATQTILAEPLDTKKISARKKPTWGKRPTPL